MSWQFGVLAILVSGSAMAEDVCSSGFRAYQNTIYKLQRTSCANCHAGQDQSISPHASADPITAYKASLQLVNFTNLDASKMVRRVRSQHWLDYDPNERGATETEVKQALTLWWEGGESSCSFQFAYETVDLAIPDNLPTRQDGKYTEMKWDLGNKDKAMNGVTLKLEIQLFNPHEPEAGKIGAYRVRNLRISTSKNPVHIEGVRLIVSDSLEPFENVYESVNKIIAKGDEFKTLATDEMVVMRRQEKDRIRLAFSDLSVVNSPRSCRAQSEFQNTVMPIIGSTKCTSCHASKNSFIMDTNKPDLLCQSFFERVNEKIPEDSVVFTFAAYGKNSHSKDLTGKQIRSIIQWIKAEVLP